MSPATCRPDTGKAYVLLRVGAGSRDVLRGAFHAHVLLHMLDSQGSGRPGLATVDGTFLPRDPEPHLQSRVQRPTGTADREMLLSVRKEADMSCPLFLQSCLALGWDLHHTMLNPHEPRLMAYAL